MTDKESVSGKKQEIRQAIIVSIPERDLLAFAYEDEEAFLVQIEWTVTEQFPGAWVEALVAGDARGGVGFPSVLAWIGKRRDRLIEQRVAGLLPDYIKEAALALGLPPRNL